MQAGTSGEASFSYNWLANCGTTAPPISSTFAITGVTPVSCLTVSAGLRQLIFSPQYAGLTGQPISFSVANELSPTNPGPYTLNLYIDNPVITLKAMQTGTSVGANYTYNWLANCDNNAQMQIAKMAIAETTLSIRVLGNPTTNGQMVRRELKCGGQMANPYN
jgi:hypothetical protein